jgi:hypothetical protein
MKVVSGTRMDREYKVIHEGASKALVYEKITEFIDWFNQCSAASPLMNAIQGHVHFETLHPFCDGNGRIGRNLILMGLCRDLGRTTPLALSRSFNTDLETYYRQFEAKLDLTDTIQSLSPLYLNAIKETGHILELTAYRTKVGDQSERLNERQLKVLNRLIDYELRGGFEGGMTTGMPLIIRGVMKPIPTMLTPIKTVDIESKEETDTRYERSDVCALPRAVVVIENIIAPVLANAFLAKYGGDSISEIEERYAST